MKNLLKTAALFIFFVCLTNQTMDAAVLDSDILIKKVKKDVKENVSTFVKGKIIVDVTNIPYKSIEIPNGKAEINTAVNLKIFTPFTVVKTSIIVDGKIVKSFGVPVKISVFDKVWVAKDTINNGSALTNQNICLEDKEISLITENVTREDFQPVNVKTKKSYKPGDIIDSRYISKTPDVIRNNLVSIIFKNQNFSVVLSGQALENGKIGDFIKVRNKQYKKDYIGKVIGENKILINI